MKVHACSSHGGIEIGFRVMAPVHRIGEQVDQIGVKFVV
jgi:hypothetical protein